MATAPGLEQLLVELSDRDEAERLARFSAECHPLGPEGAGPVLKLMLSSPDKWQRDLAAHVANEMGFDPFQDEDDAPVAAEAPVLTLGFDDDPAPPSTPPVAAAPVVTIGADHADDDEDEVAVRFLGPCDDPLESASRAQALGGGTAKFPKLLWVAAGLAVVSGVVVYLWLSPGGGGFLR